MDAGKLGRSIARKAWLDRANAAVARAVSEIETRGIRPVYIERTCLSEIRRQLAPVCAEPALIEWARTIIDVELGSPDSIRDRVINDDALFERRFNAIRQELD